MKVTIENEGTNLTVLGIAYPEVRALTELVDRFSLDMKRRLVTCWLSKKRGWDEPEMIPQDFLERMIHKNCDERDFVDVANLAAIAWNRQ